MSKLYSPPTWEHVQQCEGSLKYSVTTSMCTYKVSGHWSSAITPGADYMNATPDYFFDRPTTISDALAAEMQAAGMPGTYV